MNTPKRTDNDDGIDPLKLPHLIWLTPEEAELEFDHRARELTGVSGDEFAQRVKAGEYDDIPDDPEHWDLIFLGALVSRDR